MKDYEPIFRRRNRRGQIATNLFFALAFFWFWVAAMSAVNG